MNRNAFEVAEITRTLGSISRQIYYAIELNNYQFFNSSHFLR